MADKKFFTTPKGKALWPFLVEPDRKFNKDGVFRVDVVLTPEEAEPILDIAQGLIDKKYDEVKAELKETAANAKGKKKADAKAALQNLVKVTPGNPDYDADGEETGDIILRFKANALIRKKDGSTKRIKMNLFDAKKKRITGNINVGNGSIVRVNAEPRAYYMGKDSAVGCTFYIRAVQIIELKSYGIDADSAGFDEEDEGFDASEFADEESGEVTTDVDDDDGDF